MRKIRLLVAAAAAAVSPAQSASLLRFWSPEAAATGTFGPAAFDAAAAQTAVGRPHSASAARNVQISRRDRFRLTPTSRVCVEAMIDLAVMPRIEAGGERVSSRALTFMLTDRIWDRFHSLGLSHYLGTPERTRVNSYISDIADRSCLERRDNVLVRLRVGSDAGGRGYRITIEASQGVRHYSSAIQRTRIITVSDQTRQMIPPESESVPTLGTPFWDVSHDSYRLATLLTDHIFAGNRL